MRSANPALTKNTFLNLNSSETEHMTLNGTVNKTFILLLLLTISSVFSWQFASTGRSTTALIFTGLIVGLIIAFVTIFKKEWAPITAPLYVLFEGLFLGAISFYFEMIFLGIAMQAVLITFGILFSLLLAYKSRLIKVTENFKLGIIAATGGIFLIYLVSFILRLFGTTIPYIHGNELIGIGFSVAVIIIASLNLVLDFDFIEHGAEARAPKYMEWYAGFGLMVTLIWLYIEILHLLAKLRSRD